MTQAITLTKGSISVEVSSAQVEHDIQNNLIKFAIPVIEDQDTTIPDTFVTDIKQIINVITVTGYLSSDSTSTALQKKEALVSTSTLAADHPEAPSSIGAVWKSGAFTLTWRTETFDCYVDKLKITDSATRKERAAYCSLPVYNNQSDCESNSGTWFSTDSGGEADKYEIVLTLTMKPG